MVLACLERGEVLVRCSQAKPAMAVRLRLSRLLRMKVTVGQSKEAHYLETDGVMLLLVGDREGVGVVGERSGEREWKVDG